MPHSSPDPAPRRSGTTVALIAVVFAACVACGRTASTPAAGVPVRPTYDPATGRLTELAFDADGDATFEVTAQMDGRVVRHLDVDANADGLPERREHYLLPSAGHPAASEPRLSLLEQFDASGTLRRREGYEAGELAWAEEDRDGDGTMDRQETWTRGALTSATIVRPGVSEPLRLLYPDGSRPAPSLR